MIKFSQAIQPIKEFRKTNIFNTKELSVHLERKYRTGAFDDKNASPKVPGYTSISFFSTKDSNTIFFTFPFDTFSFCSHH